MLHSSGIGFRKVREMHSDCFEISQVHRMNWMNSLIRFSTPFPNFYVAQRTKWKNKLFAKLPLSKPTSICRTRQPYACHPKETISYNHQQLKCSLETTNLRLSTWYETFTRDRSNLGRHLASVIQKLRMPSLSSDDYFAKWNDRHASCKVYITRAIDYKCALPLY